MDLKIVSSAEELQQAFGVRILVYIGEQACPWAEEFDGNDFAATQILGTVDGEPVATARIRWFQDFAKLERLSIRPEWRGGGNGHRLLQYLMEICRKKGFRRLYLHAQMRLASFYRGYGFEIVGQPFGFSDHDYLEMACNLAESEDRLTLEHGPMVLNRPEGAWESVGVLEASLDRMEVPLSA
ncbi:GNAT family N-acetyltransferase [Lacibacterium aquatile]|uniref:GNAT family N-acetyltransferase n=1 Tax=Lacibacterium aquatile TaxID=1168082 RepID=A0ABW5DQX0_9PROT